MLASVRVTCVDVPAISNKAQHMKIGIFLSHVLLLINYEVNYNITVKIYTTLHNTTTHCISYISLARVCCCVCVRVQY